MYSSLDHFCLFLGFAFVDVVSEGPRLEHCRFWLPFTSVFEEVEPVAHFSTPSWFLNGRRIAWHQREGQGSMIFFLIIFIISYCIVRLHHYQYYFWDIISKALPTKAKERFTCPWDTAIPCWTLSQKFQGHGVLLLLFK